MSVMNCHPRALHVEGRCAGARVATFQLLMTRAPRRFAGSLLFQQQSNNCGPIAAAAGRGRHPELVQLQTASPVEGAQALAESPDADRVDATADIRYRRYELGLPRDARAAGCDEGRYSVRIRARLRGLGRDGGARGRHLCTVTKAVLTAVPYRSAAQLSVIRRASDERLCTLSAACCCPDAPKPMMDACVLLAGVLPCNGLVEGQRGRKTAVWLVVAGACSPPR